MTIATVVSKSGPYSGNGVTDEFAADFLFFDDSDLVVILTDAAGVETIQTLTTHYTVAGAGNPAGGDVTMLIPPATGELLTVKRVIPFTQAVDYINPNKIDLDILERSMDEITMLTQQLQEISDRSVKFKASTLQSEPFLPEPVADTVLGWNAAGTALVNRVIDGEDIADVVTLAGVQTLTNKTLTSPTINGGALSGTFSGNPLFSGTLTVASAAPIINLFETDATADEGNWRWMASGDILSLQAGTDALSWVSQLQILRTLNSVTFWLFDKGQIRVRDVTDSSSPTSGSFQTDGGAGIAQKLFVGSQVDIDQASASAAIPVLVLTQGDIDDTFINLIGTSAADSTRSISSSTAEAAAKFGAFRVEINGVTKWVRVYDSAV